MANDNAMQIAKANYAALCKMMDNRGWHYTPDDEKLIITCSFSGEDIPMKFLLHVRADREVVSLVSFLPFKMPEDKRIDGALAVTVANHGMVNGCFDYDLSDGEVMFRLATAFHDTVLSEEVYRYMILVAASTVDRYNDRFLMLAKGKSDIKQFIEEEND